MGIINLRLLVETCFYREGMVRVSGFAKLFAVTSDTIDGSRESGIDIITNDDFKYGDFYLLPSTTD